MQVAQPDIYYTYFLRDPRPEKSKEVFYVGKGKKRRMYDHWERAMSGKHGNPKLQSKLLKIKSEGFESPIYEKIVEDVSEDLALALEQFFIATISRRNLCNMTSGGDGVSGYKFTEEERRKNSERVKLYFSNPEARRKVSEKSRGRKHREETLRKMSQWHKTRYSNPEERRKQSEKQRLRFSNPEERLNNSDCHRGLKKSNNTSGFVGVFRSRTKWEAKIKINCKLTRLGRFPTALAAAFAYDTAALRLIGPDARINFPLKESTRRFFAGVAPGVST